MIPSRRLFLQGSRSILASRASSARIRPASRLQQSILAKEQKGFPSVWSRHLATSPPPKEEQDKKKEEEEDVKEEAVKNDDNTKESSSGDSLRDTVNRLKNNKDTTRSGDVDSSSKDILHQAANWFDNFTAEVGNTWQELVKAGERKDINKKLRQDLTPHATAEGEQEYTGPVSIMVIDESEHLTAWERMQRRLTEAPIIQNMLEKGEDIYVKSGAKDAKAKVDDLREDAREAWETSQNPWVYRASSVYDTLTAETAESIAVKELRILDPEFTLDDWRRDVVGYTLPQIMEWFLQGKVNQLKPWLGEAVFKRLASEAEARKQEGVQIDTHVLGIMNSEILAVEPDEVNRGSPIILLHFMCQQINCVRKKETGEVVEGSEDDIRANSYVCAFQREYNEEEAELTWKIVDFRFNGAIAYL
ncbi:membrane translocase subunit TIM44 [Seminavis robusta]|uniref:Membrane translocase subunit TIM44 n=1 Tax=Seminavis robusta TaxID=568900 RepID=A0A9N8HSR0_9STRA|nr:membrane translocase subunit TIM44 [Seminavis robusta]|eukprot:Sro1552_g281890.1 membrane translocase subunit TIM44 (418) ;mRNA; f:25667-27018